jgi:peptidyl-prolyl cis-trans isomerase A (cyclophilin A)
MTPRLLPALLLIACGSDPSDSETASSEATSAAPRVTCETTLGAFTVQLDPDAAPITTQNFLTYVDDGFYDGSDGLGETLFHRVIPNFMAQGGGMLASGALKATREPIAIESDNGLSNLRGTIAMARTNVPNSATSQFFINVVDNLNLNYQSEANPGYAVFGEVTHGMDTIDAIVAVPRNSADRPNTDVRITACARG